MRRAHSLLTLVYNVALAVCARVNTPQVPVQAPPSNQTVSWSLFTKLEGLARLVDTTYCINPSNIGITYPFNCLSRCSTFPNLELITTWHTGLLLTDSAGFIALDHAPDDKRIVVAFRGTLSLANVVVDLATIPQAYVPYLPDSNTTDGTLPAPGDSTAPQCQNCTVHMGFLQSWHDARDQIIPHVSALRAAHPAHRIELVGHSLGGAVALLAALDMHGRGWTPSVTTFGQPRVGNGAFAQWVDDAFDLRRDDDDDEATTWSGGQQWRLSRVTHVDDPVPLLPLADWGYVAHGGEIYVGKPDVPPDIWDLRLCRGHADTACSAHGGAAWYNPLSALSAHRNYFWTLGLCVPDSWKNPGGWM